MFWLHLPTALEENCNDTDDGRIDLCTENTPWTPDVHRYISHGYDESKTQFHLRLDPVERLIDVRSATATMIANVLAPLEFAQFIVVSYRDGVVRVALPRLKLDFRITEGFKLECKQFPGMIVDADQHIGAFIGLENFLVVRLGDTLKRSVFVPYGKVRSSQQHPHTIVQIDTAGVDRVKYHLYSIDTILGRLVGNGSLTSHLYKIYLHAVTSHCHPDPLTRRTGTEEALAGLRAAATKSIQGVEANSIDAHLFQLIAALSPVRVYYPMHLKCMQQVRWNTGLPPLAQHEEFSAGVKKVSDYAELLEKFEGVNGSIGLQNSGKEYLAKRAAVKNAVFLSEQFGGSMVENTEDRLYEARDLVNGSSDEARVFYTATLVDRYAGGRLNVHPNLLHMLENLGAIKGPLPSGETLKLGYDDKWLDPVIQNVWVSLYDGLRGTGKFSEKYNCMFLLSTLVYLGKIDLTLIETLLAFKVNRAFRWIEPPDHSSYNLQEGYEPNVGILSSAISSHVVDFSDSSESKMPSRSFYSERENHERRSQAFSKNKGTQVAALSKKILSAWPCRQPTIDDLDDYPLIRVPKVLEALIPWFESWNRNSNFRRHISEVQEALDAIRNNRDPVFQYHHFEPCASGTTPRIRTTIRFTDLLGCIPPTLPPCPVELGQDIFIRKSSTHPGPNEGGLKALLRDFRRRMHMSGGQFRERYSDGLEASLEAFHAENTESYTFNLTDVQHLREKLTPLLDTSQIYMKGVFEAIEVQLGPSSLRGSSMAPKAGLWPRVSPVLLLQQLAIGSATVPPEWKSVLVTYGISITMVQRLGRLLCLLSHEKDQNLGTDFLKELENRGHQGWDPHLHPDWLLIEIENDFLIRRVQAEIAELMIEPPENRNSIMQLCMGEGKTSVIVPIVAASLANGEKLVRVVVLKPLSGQMFQTLVQKLGGLVNRQIFFMPFSRRTSLGKEEIAMVRRLCEDCMLSRGILLVQPEHILSFKLVGLERLYSSENKGDNGNGVEGSKCDAEVAPLLLDMQRWLEDRSRDILDESDEILNVRHELIYTIGGSAPIEGSPDRWLIIQEIFDLVQDYLKGPEEIGVQDFEVERHKDEKRFGSVRILNPEAGRTLLGNIGKKAINGAYSADSMPVASRYVASLQTVLLIVSELGLLDQLLTVSFRLFPVDKRELAVRFITDISMTKDDATPLLDYCRENTISAGILYLLRGLIAHNIILFSLKDKRWKVDYGLDLKRTLLAVPYCAKDSPAAKAEFSHPDVALTFTCLSYYYGGLSELQLETCFHNLYQSDNPALEYERWITGISQLPKAYLKRLNGINLDDRKQWKETIYPTFQYNKAVIDSYLSGVVFPKEAKDFPHKLSTSGWDLAASKVHPTTGFSGTNDNRYLLPLSITQLDTEAQLNTNARVLSYLLQSENSYTRIATNNNERMGVVQLLEMLVAPPQGPQLKVLLDVGAQVLELRNAEVAEQWLELAVKNSNSVVAAVYFNDNDELTVLTEDGTTEPLRVSAFAESLGNCLVYLDEAHTRGTDLKLPLGSRAAVTLGPNLTKDRLVQGEDSPFEPK